MADGFGLDQVGQIALTVDEVARATAFYRDRLGMRHLFSAGDLSFFECVGLRLMLSAPEGAGQRVGSTLYFKVDDINAACETLAHRGVEFVDAPHVIATMADHTVWMAFFRDGEQNMHGLMSEVPL